MELGTSFKFYLAIFLTLSLVSTAGNQKPESIAIFGDSISAGSAADTRLAWNVGTLADLFFGANQAKIPVPEGEKPKESPLKLTPDQFSKDFRELVTDKDGNVLKPKRIREPSLKSNMAAMLEDSLSDTPSFTWGFLAGRKLGVDPKNIKILARMGKKVEHVSEQISLLLPRKNSTLPDQMNFLFTGNDLCGKRTPENIEAYDFAAQEKYYKDKLMDGFKILLERGEPDEGKTVNVNVLTFLPVGQLIANPAVRKKKVPYFDKKVSCDEFRKAPGKEITDKMLKNPRVKTLVDIAKLLGELKNNKIPPASNMCPGVLGVNPDDKKQVDFIEKLVDAYNRGIVEAIKEANALRKEKYADKKITFNVVKAPSDFKLEAEDVANDCFHLSLKGHEKLARLFVKEVSGEDRKIGKRRKPTLKYVSTRKTRRNARSTSTTYHRSYGPTRVYRPQAPTLRPTFRGRFQNLCHRLRNCRHK